MICYTCVFAIGVLGFVFISGKEITVDHYLDRFKENVLCVFVCQKQSHALQSACELGLQ